MTERMADVEASLGDTRHRMGALEAEEAELTSNLVAARELREGGAAATEALFQQRDEAEVVLRQRQEAAERLSEALAEAERKVRVTRAAERESVDRRHALELERQELVGRIGRIQDRLEGEWGKSLELLMAEAEPLAGDPEELKEELFRVLDQGLKKSDPS